MRYTDTIKYGEGGNDNHIVMFQSTFFQNQSEVGENISHFCVNGKDHYLEASHPILFNFSIPPNLGNTGRDRKGSFYDHDLFSSPLPLLFLSGCNESVGCTLCCPSLPPFCKASWGVSSHLSLNFGGNC